MNRHFEFLRASLHELSLVGFHADTEVSCHNGKVFLNRLVLGLMFPDLTSLLLEHEQYAVIIPGFGIEEFSEIYEVLFINDRIVISKDEDDTRKRIANVGEFGKLIFKRKDKEILGTDIDGLDGKGVNGNAIPIKQGMNKKCEDHRYQLTKHADMKDVKEHHLKVTSLQHEASKVRKFSSSCNICNKLFYSRKSLMCHMTTHPETSALSCDVNNLLCNWCKKAFDSKSALVVHEVTVHRDTTRLDNSKNDRITRCGICGKLFMNCIDFKTHILFHLKDRPDKEEMAEIIIKSQFSFPCTSCRSKFSTKGALDQHIIKFHLNPKASVCDICQKSFLSRELCAKHMLTIHNDCGMLKQIKKDEGIEIDIFNCKTCQKAFTAKSKLDQHEKDHLDPSLRRKHLCSHCPKSFPTPASREIHERSHTGEKPFKCNFCGLGFAAKGNLVSHKKSHLNKKAFICSTCGKGFNTKRDRKTHETHTHSSTKAFVCDNCGESYKRVMNLKRHKRVCKMSL